MNLIARQSWTMLVQAYRELNAKKMFWVVLVLSLMCAGAMGTMGINEQGLTVLFWDIPSPMFSTNVMEKATFYKLMFISLGFKLWLAWAATILAIISTAGIMPDFVSGGTIELSLSKPIGRLRLLLTKYITGLLFVTLQVSVFTLAAFLIIGIRGGVWLYGLFIAIPLIVLFFSYLFSVCTLIGLVTRSTITALLGTILLWGVIFLFHMAETGIILQFKVRQDIIVASYQVDIQTTKDDLQTARVELEKADDDQRLRMESRVDRLKGRVESRQKKLDKAETTQAELTKWHALLFGVKTVLPKTSETMDLLNRKLLSSIEMESFTDAIEDDPAVDLGTDSDIRISQRQVGKKMQEELESRSVGWVIGTSLLFELAVLGLAAGFFVRKDY